MHNANRCRSGPEPETSSRFRTGQSLNQRLPHDSGQALIESCIVIMLASVLLLGMLQLSQVFAAKEFLNYAASRGVRARTVGFNDFMVEKTVRIGAIPNAGKMITPGYQRTAATWGISDPDEMWSSWYYLMRAAPISDQLLIEQSCIPLYLRTDWRWQCDRLLDYEDWDTISRPSPIENDLTGLVSLRLTQEYELKMPLHRTFYADDFISMQGEAEIENHYPLYLE